MGSIAMVASGKDGVGKSTLSVFLGAALAELESRVLVIELDDGFRSIDVISGAYTRIVYTVHDVLSERCEVSKAIIPSPIDPNLFIMSAPVAAVSLPIDKFAGLVKRLQNSFDYIIIDTACNVSSRIAAAEVSDRAIVVATPDPTSIRDTKFVADNLAALKVSDIKLAVNRMIPERIALGIIPHLDYCMDSIGVQLIGVIPELDEIALADAGVAMFNPRGLAKHVFHNIADRFLGKDVPLIVR